MKLRLTAVILLSLCLSQAFADEGMWLLGEPSQEQTGGTGDEGTRFADACK